MLMVLLSDKKDCYLFYRILCVCEGMMHFIACYGKVRKLAFRILRNSAASNLSIAISRNSCTTSAVLYLHSFIKSLGFSYLKNQRYKSVKEKGLFIFLGLLIQFFSRNLKFLHNICSFTSAFIYQISRNAYLFIAFKFVVALKF